MAEDWGAEALDFKQNFEGREAILRVKGAKSGPAYRPVFGPSTDHTIKVMTFGFSAYEKANLSVQANDVRVLFPAHGLDFQVTMSDLLIIDGIDYDIVDIDKVQPGDVPIFWKAHARSRG